MLNWVGFYYFIRFRKFVILPEVRAVNRFEPNLILYIQCIILIISYIHQQMHTVRSKQFISLRKIVVQFTAEVYVLVFIILCIFNSQKNAPPCRNMEECSKTYL